MFCIYFQIHKNGIPTGGLPDLYWFDLKGLHPIIDLYGESSNTAVEATELVISASQQIKAVFDEAYQNKVNMFDFFYLDEKVIKIKSI